MLSARVEPLAALVYLRHLRQEIEQWAEYYERIGTPAAREAARQMRLSLRQFKDAAAQCVDDQAKERLGAVVPAPEQVVDGSGASSEGVLLGPGEVARQVGLSDRLIRRYCDEGRLPGSFRERGRWRIPPKAVTEFEKARSKR